MPVDDVGSRVDELPKDKKLLFICAQGFRSGLACEMAAAMGIDSENLYNVEDGTPTWSRKAIRRATGPMRRSFMPIATGTRNRICLTERSEGPGMAGF